MAASTDNQKERRVETVYHPGLARPCRGSQYVRIELSPPPPDLTVLDPASLSYLFTLLSQALTYGQLALIHPVTPPTPAPLTMLTLWPGVCQFGNHLGTD